MKRFTVIYLLLLATVAFAGNPLPGTTPNPNAKTWHWRWAYQDNATWWKYTAYWPGKEVHTSWLDHSVGSYMLFEYCHQNRKMSNKKSLIWVMALGAAWEAKDALAPYEKCGKLGGEGFSGQDLIRDATGCLTAMLFNYVTEKRSKKKIVLHYFPVDSCPPKFIDLKEK